MTTRRTGTSRSTRRPPPARAKNPSTKRRNRSPRRGEKTPRSAQRARAAATGGEYVMVPVTKLEPAPWQPRLVFREIEELADSIRGDGLTEGVGVAEPILVRPLGGGRFQIIDGERRWRAMKLIAKERPGVRLSLPARVLQVSDRVAQLVGQAANHERDQPTALETALSYRRLREALEAESSGRSIGVRTVAGIGWHRRSQVHDYLAVAERLTPEVLRQAGVLDANGRADEELVAALRLSDLLAAANARTDEERIAALRARAVRVRGGEPPAPTAPAPTGTARSLQARAAELREAGGLRVRIRAPLRTLPAEAARQLLHDHVAPAMLALVEQTRGTAGQGGSLTDITEDHALVIVPQAVEQLSPTQLEVLSRELGILSKRVARAVRFHRGRERDAGRTR